jgi:hypothetical protein
VLKRSISAQNRFDHRRGAAGQGDLYRLGALLVLAIAQKFDGSSPLSWTNHYERRRPKKMLA